MTDADKRKKQLELNKRLAAIESKDEERKRARKLFKKFDINGDNSIDDVEFVALARELGLQITLEQAREAIASIDADGSKTVDFDEFYEWYRSPLAQEAAAAALMNDLRSRLRRYTPTNVFIDAVGPMFGIFLPSDFSFKRFAVSSLKGLSSATTGTAFESSRKKKVRAIFNEVDTDGSGAIDREEFRALLNKMGYKDVDDKTLDEYISHIDLDGNGTIEFEEFYHWWCSDPAHANDADAVHRLRLNMKSWTIKNIWHNMVKGTALEKTADKSYDSAREEEEEIAAEMARRETEDKKGAKKRKIKVTSASDIAKTEAQPEAEGKKKKGKAKDEEKKEEDKDDEDTKEESFSGQSRKAKISKLEGSALDDIDDIDEITKLLKRRVNDTVLELRAEILTLKEELREMQKQNLALQQELQKVKAEKSGKQELSSSNKSNTVEKDVEAPKKSESTSDVTGKGTEGDVKPAKKAGKNASEKTRDSEAESKPSEEPGKGLTKSGSKSDVPSKKHRGSDKPAKKTKASKSNPKSKLKESSSSSDESSEEKHEKKADDSEEEPAKKEKSSQEKEESTTAEQPSTPQSSKKKRKSGK